MTITLDWKSRSRSAGTRTLSAPPSRVAAGRQRARVRRPSRPLPWGRSTGRRRTAASQAARASAPEAQGAAHAVRSRYADASHPEPRGHGRCSGPATAQSSAGRSSSPRRHPRSCAPALRAKSPESAASRSDHGLTGTSLPDPRRSDDQQPAPWLASATHSAPAYTLLNNPGILNPSPSPGARIMLEIDFTPDNWNRECASTDRVAGISEERDARGLEDPANSCVIAVTEGVEIRKSDPVLDPMAVK